MLGWIYADRRTQGLHSREQLELQLSNAGKRNQVEPFGCKANEYQYQYPCVWLGVTPSSKIFP
jgi:hypothetical protein